MMRHDHKTQNPQLLGIAPAALCSTVRSGEARADPPASAPGRTFRPKPRRYVARSGLSDSDPVISELRNAWRFDFEGDGLLP
jgi:hypothetical protein